MTFIVQDLLDYAQIKAGKFRKNITKFDLRECIEKVMCIQRQKAEDKNINFNVRYRNFREDQNVNDVGEFGELHSYVLKTDE
jgi:signal transduction histidine kinase